MPSPRPKPTRLKVLQGTFRKCRAPQNEPQPAGDLVDPPQDFDDDERALWAHALECAPDGLLKRLDGSILELWVRAMVTYRREMALYKAEGGVVYSPSGNPMSSPHLNNATKQAAIAHRAAVEMGFSPSSRTRVSIDADQKAESGFEQFAT